MASSCFFNQAHSSFPAKISNRRSKAQMCLDKIIRTIVSYLPNEQSKLSIAEFGVGEGLRDKNRDSLRGSEIDLNLRLSHSVDVEDSEFKATDKRSEGDCDQNHGVLYGDLCCKPPEVEDERNGEESEVIDQKTTEISSEITDLLATSLKNGDTEETDVVQQNATLEGSEMVEAKHNYLGLLVEAARLVSGDFESDESESEKRVIRKVNENGSKRKGEWEAYRDISPVVRSKRGRSQVLPYRYRDSVLEPWKHVSKPERSSMVSSSVKRRSK